MRKIILVLILIIASVGNSLAQNEERAKIEYYVPACIIENYCNPNGLPAIKRAIVADKAVSGMNIIPDNTTERPDDSIIVFRYKNNMVSIECGLRERKLGIFRVAFPSEDDLLDFGISYMFELELLGTDKTAETTRYYSEHSPMNAIMINHKPWYGMGGKPLYVATCFAFQSGFCQ